MAVFVEQYLARLSVELIFPITSSLTVKPEGDKTQPMARDWKEMVFNIPFNPNHSGIP